MTRKEKIIKYSNILGFNLGLNLVNSEFNYGKGIGRADNYCIINDWYIVIEMEFSQRHPEMNVLKAWPFLENNPSKKIFLIQHLVDKNSVSPNRVELCNWIAAKMEAQLSGRFKYHLLIKDLDPIVLNIVKEHMKRLNIL